MPRTPMSKMASVSINIRAKAKQRDLIDQAADRIGRSRSEFMLEATCREVEDILLDQTFFTVDAFNFAKFLALLDNPLPPTDQLRGLLKIKAPWGEFSEMPPQYTDKCQA